MKLHKLIVSQTYIFINFQFHEILFSLLFGGWGRTTILYTVVLTYILHVLEQELEVDTRVVLHLFYITRGRID